MSSMIDVFRNYTPVENPEFGARKKLIGDAVAQVQSLSLKGKDKQWVIFKCEAIHVIPDAKGRETTVAPGDELTKVYDPSDAEAMQDLANDLFTAGITVEPSAAENDEALIDMMAESAKGKLVYFRTWAKDKTKEQIEASKPGSPPYFQNINIKSKNLITPENSVPMLPF